MTDNDNRRWLYEQMQKNGYNAGTYEEFDSAMNDKANRDWVYKQFSGLGYNMGSTEEFEKAMMGDARQQQATKPSQQPAATTPAQQGERSPYQMAQSNTPTYDYGGQMPPAQRPTKSKATSKPTQTAEAQPLGPEKFAKQMQFEQRVRQSVPSPEAMMQDFSQRMDAVRRDGRPLGGDASQPFGGYEDVFAPARRQRETEEAKAQIRVQVSTLKDEVSAALNERGQQLDSEAMRTSLGDRPMGGGALVHTFNSSTVNGRYGDERWKMLNAANNALANAEKMIREADTKGGVHDWAPAELVRGFEKVGDPRTWDFGLTEGVDATALMGALDKADRGETLTREEQMLLDAKAVEMATKMYYESGASGWYKAGEVTADAIPYMLEFMINPAAKAGRSAQSILTRYALKRFGKEALKTFGKDYLKGNAMRFGGRVLADIGGSGVMNITTGMARVAGGTVERANGQVRYSTDTDGNSVFAGRENQKDPTTAFMKSLGSGWIEQHSELFGAYFAPLFKGAGKLIKGGMLSKAGKAMRLDRVYDAIDNISHSDWAKVVADFEKNAQWHGPIEEWGEEMVGGIENAIIVGDQTLDADPETGVFNRENMLETLRSVAVMGGAFAAAKTAGYRTPKHQGKRAMTEADDAALAAFGGDQYTWGGIRNTIAFGSDEDALRRMNEVMTDPNISPEQKKAALDYYKAAYSYKGMLAGDGKRKADGAVTPEQEAAEEAYDKGYDAVGDETAARDIAMEFADESIGRSSAEERQAAWEGLQQHINENADEMADRLREEGAKMMHGDGSMRPAVLKVKNENGEDTEVYIVSGEVVMTADGTMVDRDRTLEANGGSTSIVIYDPATGERRQIDPTSDMGILSIGEATSAEDFEYEIQRRRDEYVQRMLDEAQGTVRVELGQSLTMPDGIEGTVMAISPDGESFTVVANDGSGEVRMERSDLQQVADAAALADYQARHQEEAAEQPTEEATGEQAAVAPGIVEGAPAEFLPDMRLMVRDDDGETKEAVVQGRVRYDGGQFVPDENGQIVEYMMDGEVHHDQIPTLSNKTDGYIEAPVAVPEETEQAEGAEAVPQPTESQEQAEVQQEESTVPAGESAETATAPAAAVEPMPMRTVRRKIDGKWQDVEEEDWMSTTPARAYQYLYEEAVGLGLPIETVDNLVKSNLDNAQRDVERAKKATGSIVSVLQKQREAQAVVDYWQQVQSLRNQQLLAEAEARDAATREERERRRAETEAARKRDQEAYEAEVARRKAEQEKEKREQESKLEAMAKIGEESRAMGIDWPIEKDAEAMEVMNDIVPHTLEEVAAWMLGDTRGGYKIDPDAIRAHTGYGTADMKKFPFVFAKGGMSPEAFGEKIEQIARENDVNFDESDTNAGFNALLNVLGEAGSLGDLKNYIKNNRRAQAEEIHSANLRREASAQAEDRWIAQHGGMTREEYESYINWMEDAVEQGKIAITDEEYNQLFNTDYDRGTETNDEGSDQRGAEEGSADESEAGQAAAAADDTRGDGEETEPAASPVAEAIAQQEVEENPTEGQKEAGNYKKAHVKVDGLDITIENKKGSTRSGVDPNGRAWSQTMNNNYGYILGTEGVDGDHIDMFLSDTPEQGDVFVVDQVNADGTFDEHKVMYGFPDIESAREAYLSNYEEGWQGLGAITPVSKDEFKKWVESSHRKTKPFSEYRSVETLGDVQVENKPVEEEETPTEEYKAPDKEEGEDVISYAQRVADGYKQHEESRIEREKRLQEERKQRILTNGTSFDKPFGLVPVSETMTAADIEANVTRIVDELRANAGNDKLEPFEGFAYQGDYQKNAGNQVDEYLLSLEGVVPKETLAEWYNGHSLKNRDDIRALGEKMYKKAGEYKAPAREEGEAPLAYAQRVADAHKAYEEKQRHRQEIDDASARVADAVASGEREAIEKASAELEKLTQAEDETLHREGEGNQTVEIPYKESLAKSKAAGYTKKQHDAMVERRWKQRIKQAKDYAERLNLGDRVTVVLSADELEAQGMTLSEEQKRDKGWYNKRTGQIFVIMENNTSMDDVLKTILHEGVGHHGLRELFGKHFSQFLWNVYENADESIRGEIVELSKAHGWNTETAIEEYLARLAESENFERPELQSWWQKVKQCFLEMLHKIGFEDFNPERVITDNELRYILWRSYENLVEPDRYRSIVEEAKDIAKQWNLGVGRYEEGATTEGNRWDSEELKAAESVSEMEPVGRSIFGDIYDQFKGKAKEALAFLKSHHDSDMVGVFNREGWGDVDLIWGDENGGAEHILSKHVGEGKSFASEDEAMETISDIIKNGDRVFENGDRAVFKAGDNQVTVRKNWREEGKKKADKNWVLTSYNEMSADSGSPAATIEDQAGKVTDKTGAKVQNNSDMAKNNSQDADILHREADKSKSSNGGANAEEDILHRDGEDVPKVHAREAYERMMNRGITQFTEAVQDSMLGLKNLYKAILDAEGKSARIDDVKGYENAYLAENRMHSASEAQTFAWQKQYMDPLTDEVYKLTRGKKKIGKGFRKDLYNELVDYMMAKHGLERNAVFAERDAMKAAEGGASYDEAYSENRSRDYAGLTALTGKQDVAEAEAEAMRMVEEYESKHDTEALWEKVNAATKSSLYTLAASGLMTPERHKQVRDMFKYYIPLQGFDEKVSENVYAYMGSDGTLGYGTPIRAAKGRKSRADDPLATIRMNGEAAIRQANRNDMKKHFLRFVQSHPSDLVSISDVWLRKNDVTGEWEQYFDADLQETDSPAEVAQKVYEFEQRMENLANEHPEQYKRSKDLPNVPFRVVKDRDMRQHQVLVQSGGKNYVLTINGNPRAAQALNGMTNPDVNTENLVGKALNIAQAATRMRSLLVTSLSPAFVLSNYLRDMGYSNLMVWVKENPKYALEFNKQFFSLGFPSATKLAKKDMENMVSLYAKWKSGKLQEKVLNGTANERERMFYEFKTNGGETGFTSWHSIEHHKKTFEKSLRRGGDINKNVWKALKGWLDLFNQVVENNARFAAYVASRKTGRSVERSVWDAKEISVNFNKKGAGDKFLTAKGQKPIGVAGSIISGYGRGFLMFFNASVQGTFGNFAKNIVRNPVKGAGLVSAMALLGYFAPMISEMLCNAFGGDDGDDDDKNAYYNLPEYVRRGNLCFRWSREMPWIKLPLAIEFRAAYGFGELTRGIISGGERYTKEEAAEQYVSQMSQMLPVDFLEGRGGLHAFVPSLYQPWKEASDNVKWTGLPIYREKPDYRGKGDPRRFWPQWRYRPFNSADKTLVYMTKWLNEATGGDDVSQGWIDWNPAKIEYLLNQYLGGPGQAFGRVKKTIETVTGDRDFEWRNTPFLNRVLYEGDETTEARKLRDEYYNLLDEYFETGALLKGYKELAESENSAEAEKYGRKLKELEESGEYRRYKIFDEYNKICYDYYKLWKEADGEEKARYQQIQTELHRHLTNIIHASDDGDEAAEQRYTEEMESYIRSL